MEIVLDNISKVYDGKTIFTNVNEVFSEGDSIAFTGHNGCGKSTLLKIISGICAASSGKVIFNGIKKPSIAYVPEKFPSLNITAKDYLLSVAKIEGKDLKSASSEIESLAYEFNCREFLGKKMGTLSKGTLQKVGVIQALLIDSDVMILDEPLSGQDLDSQKKFIEKINTYRSKGKIVLMSCHEMDLVKAISNRVYQFKNGRLLALENDNSKLFTVLVSTDAKKWDQMVLWGDGYKLVCAETELSDVVLKLISDGFSLRGIYEND